MADSIKSTGLGNLNVMKEYSLIANKEKSLESTMKRLKGGEEINIAAAKTASTEAETKKAATQFEALLLHQMMNAMWQTVPKDGLLSGSREESLYRDMLNQAVATSIAENKSIGIRDVVMKDLQKQQKK